MDVRNCWNGNVHIARVAATKSISVKRDGSDDGDRRNIITGLVWRWLVGIARFRRNPDRNVHFNGHGDRGFRHSVVAVGPHRSMTRAGGHIRSLKMPGQKMPGQTGRSPGFREL